MTNKTEEFQPVIRRVALAMHVLVVAQTRNEGAWTAYCDAVPGMDHSKEMDEVLRSGCKLPRKIADSIFPEFKDLPYAR